MMNLFKVQLFFFAACFMLSVACSNEIPELPGSSVSSTNGDGDSSGGSVSSTDSTKLQRQKQCNKQGFFFDYNGQDGKGKCSDTEKIFTPCDIKEVASRSNIPDNNMEKFEDRVEGVASGYSFDQCLDMGEQIKVYFAMEAEENGSTVLRVKPVTFTKQSK